MIDKPQGITSFGVVDRVRRARGARKAGHAGTLDPMATGVLVVCLGRATRLVSQLMDGEKVYRACARFGVETDTLDAEGRQTAVRDASGLTEPDVALALARFVGVIRQKPPMYSALKQKGQRLHMLARAGIEVERPERQVFVKEAVLELFDPATPSATIVVTCSKGTYIRTLVADLGTALGVGAHVSALRRLKAGPFSLEQAVFLEAAGQAPLFSIPQVLQFFAPAKNV